MLLPRFSKDVKNPQQRRSLLEGAIADVRTRYRKFSVEEAREPLLRLKDQYENAGIDPLELLFAAESALQGDSFWLGQIVEIVLRKTSLTRVEISYLVRQALLTPERLDIWHRIHKERRALGDDDGYYEDRERCVRALLPYFPEGRPTRWPDSLTEGDALALLTKCLSDSLVNITSLKRYDSDSLQILDAAATFFPDRVDLLKARAFCIVRTNRRQPEDIGVVLQALVEDQGQHELMLWAGTALTEIPGHGAEGLAMLRQLLQRRPTDAAAAEAYFSALKASETLQADDLPLLAKYVARFPDDVRALEMLADYYASRNDFSPEAVRSYRFAASRSPKRIVYLRLIGRHCAERNQWSEVITLYDEIRAADAETEDMVIPLATAYAAFHREDTEAEAVYARAIELGTMNGEVHNLYCRRLYATRPTAPESIAVFSSSSAAFPDCLWAQLGLANHYLASGDTERALEAALALLQRHATDREAQRIGAAAIAQDYSRRQLARLANVPSAVAAVLFEEAYKLNPDAGPVALAVARRRIADGVRTLETARLLGEACRKNPDLVDLRIARADLLFDLGQQENAVALYRELLDRWQAGGAALPRGVTAETRRRVLLRVGEWLLKRPGLAASEANLLLEAAAEPSCSAELVVGAARIMVDLNFDHSSKLGLIERALKFAPGDRKLERALAEAHAAQGNPTRAVELVLRLLEIEDAEDDAAALLRSLQATTRRGEVARPYLEKIRTAMMVFTRPPALLLAGAEFLAHARDVEKGDLPFLERVASHFARNVRVRRLLARCLKANGEEVRAARILSELMTDQPNDDELLLELAKTNARLGQHDPGKLRLAQSALALEPRNTDLLLHVAGIELQLGDFNAASRRLEQVMEIQPELHPRVLSLLEQCKVASVQQSRLYLLLGRVHTKAGRIEQALCILGRLGAESPQLVSSLATIYEEMIARAPDNPRPRMERGTLYRLCGRLDEALADYEAAHQMAPDNADIQGELADLLNQKIDANPHATARIRLRAADLHLRLGQEEAAFAQVDSVLAREPAQADALMMLARLQMNAGVLEKCWATLQQIKDRSVALPQLQQLARAFADKGDHLRAAEVLTDAIEVAGPQRELLEQLRSVHQEQARWHRDDSARQRLLGTLSPGAQGRYELREEIGSGSMGVVYKAYDRELDEIVVLKILPEHFADDPEVLSRFRNEAKAARKLAHGNIVRIHDFGEEGGRKHISMEYVSGGDLKQYITEHRGRIPTERAIAITRDVARALLHAHSEGVLHRDIKAANILLTPAGRVKLSDFGIAALIEREAMRSTDATNVGTNLLGTPLYMSPEAFQGLPATPQSDLYSVGVLFYELLTGMPPFTRGSISYHHQYTRPAPITTVDSDLWQVVEKLLEKNPADRYRSAMDLLQALDKFQGRRSSRDGEEPHASDLMQPTPFAFTMETPVDTAPATPLNVPLETPLSVQPPTPLSTPLETPRIPPGPQTRPN